ncbi:uncharacterized protein C9orf57 homolog isoform X2 [Panthera uncia]|uniref:uncharacterized protein C9orf57 homolog isoform X2 n=1 Tax=Panthera uncia TaxID=29064 RepID=UPI0020FFD288|nr:uncharacterized protein C9orf57 homolog isoform X2 [Panthera uncia]
MRIVFSDVFTLLCLLDVSYLSSVPGGAGGVICRLCNLSIPFHGCLLDLGTCKTKPGQYCVKEIHVKDKNFCYADYLQISLTLINA